MPAAAPQTPARRGPLAGAAVLAAVLGLHVVVLDQVRAGMRDTEAVAARRPMPSSLPVTTTVAMAVPAAPALAGASSGDSSGDSRGVSPGTAVGAATLPEATTDASSHRPASMPIVGEPKTSPTARTAPTAPTAPAPVPPPRPIRRADAATPPAAAGHRPPAIHPAADRDAVAVATRELQPIDATAVDLAAGTAAPMWLADASSSAASVPGPSASEAAAPVPVLDGPPPPVYPARMPPAFRFGYDLRRGSLSGQGEIGMTIGASGYEAKLQGRVAGLTLIDWTSRGQVDAHGLVPERFVETRIGRSARAANFQREAAGGPKITYSASTESRPLPAGSQDRLTWMLQLAAIAEASPARLATGAQIVMYVTGVRADADVWTFSVVGRETIQTPVGSLETVHLVREPRKPYDTRADVWIDPAQHHLPVKARLGTQGDDKDAFELVLQRVLTGPS